MTISGNPVFDQVTLSLAATAAIQGMKDSRSPLFSWISEDTPWLSRFLSLLAAIMAAGGIAWNYSAGTFTVTNLTWASVLHGVLVVMQGVAMQHMAYKLVFGQAKPAQFSAPAFTVPPGMTPGAQLAKPAGKDQ